MNGGSESTSPTLKPSIPYLPGAGNQQAKGNRSWRLQLLGWLLLMMISSGLLLSQLNYPLFEPDEARNAEIASNFLSSGSWVTMTLNDEPYRNKPPGLFWLIAASYETFGFSPGATRLPSVLAALISIAVVLGWGQKLVGFRAAFIGSIVLLLCCGFTMVGRFAIMDACFTCCVLITSLALLLAEGQQWRHRQPVKPTNGQCVANLRSIFWFVAAGLAGGVGVMIKGPVILILTIVPIFITYALADRLSFFTLRRVLYFAIPFLFISLPWYFAALALDPEFFAEFFWKHHVMRFSNAFDHEAAWWFYLPVIFVVMFPASYLLPSLVPFLISNDSRYRNLRTPALGFCVLMSGWVILFFSCSHSKLPTYIVPALPFLALILGSMLDAKLFLRNPSTSKTRDGAAKKREVSTKSPAHDGDGQKREFLSWLPLLSPLGFVGMSMLIVVGLQIGWNSAPPFRIDQLLIFWAVLSVICCIPWLFAKYRRLAWSCLTVTALGLMMTMLYILVPNIAELRSINNALAELKRQNELTTAPIVFFDCHPFGAGLVVDKTHIHHFKLDEAIEFRDFFLKHPLAIVVASKEKLMRYCKTLESEIEFRQTKFDNDIHLFLPKHQSITLTKELQTKLVVEPTTRYR